MPFVESEATSVIDYDELSRGLVVTFTSGGRYRYENVPPSVYKDFIAAESHGRYFHEFIRDRYRYHRL
jgi:hypothetical protein